MSRETINVKDLAKNDEYPDDKNLDPDDWDTCNVISQTQISYDSEKGFVDYEVVIQRFSDDKFFKFQYTQFSHYGDDILEQKAWEVHKKKK